MVWAAKRGLATTIYRQPATSEPWWIGITAKQETGKRHWLVWAFDRIVHDPTSGWILDDPDMIPRRYTLADIEAGITLKPTGKDAHR